jgi:FG-GAP repeat
MTYGNYAPGGIAFIHPLGVGPFLFRIKSPFFVLLVQTKLTLICEISMSMANNDTTIPIEDALDDIDVIDSEFQQVDLANSPEEAKDALYKVEQGTSQRHIWKVLAAVVGITVLIILAVTLNPANEEIIRSKQTEPNESKQHNDTATTSGTPTDFTCASTTLTCPDSTTVSWWQVAQDIIGEAAYDYNGFATALNCDGSILAVSGGQNIFQAGYVRIFSWNPTKNKWSQLGNKLEGLSVTDQFGYSLAMSADGLRVAIGSRFNDGSAENSGNVRVFDYVGDSWIPVGQDIQGEAGGDQSGHSVSLSANGSRLAIGSSYNNATGTDAGHARVFELETSNGTSVWKQLGQDLDGEAAGDEFGRSVSLSGDGTRVAVGGHTNDGINGTNEDSGHVRVFEFDGDTNAWMQIGKDIDGEQPGDWFGFTVAMSYNGTRLAVGAPGDYNNYLPGDSLVFELINGTWTQLGSNLRGGSAIDMSLDGARVVTGSYRGVGNGVNSGVAVVYDFNGTEWTQVGTDIDGRKDDMSATSVAISADGMRVVSSAPSSDYNGTVDIGRVRVYDLC